MVGAVNGIGAAWNVQRYGQADAARNTQNIQKPISQQETGMQLRISGEGTTPVQPVDKVRPLGAPITQAADGIDLDQKITQGQYMEPAELAVRMRMQQGDAPQGTDAVGQQTEAVDSAQEVMEEGECQTCAERKYQDGSDDMGVSFQTPAHIAPETAAATVRGHEMEHVTRNQAKATREGKEVVSQSVTLHSAICPECGKVYISGGTTRTTTIDKPDTTENLDDAAVGAHFSAVA